MAEAAATSDAAKVDSYIGSLICLITKSEIRYEGFLFHLDAKECTIGLRNVKSFGTEGRRKDGPQVSPSEKIYEYICFRGSDIKDLQVLSAPSVRSTSAVPDDPAIIQPRHPHPPLATISLASPSAFQATNLSSNPQSGLQAPSFQGNLPPNQSVGVSVSWASMVPAPRPVNLIGPAVPNYWPGFTGLPGGTSHFHPQPFPPPPRGLVLTNPIQQPMQHPSMNASLAGSALNFTEGPRPLLPPVCTSPLTLISTLPPPSSVQSSNIPLTTLLSNLTPNSMENKASGDLPIAMVNSSSQMVSSSATSSDVNPVVLPITQKGQSLLGPVPFPIVSKSVSSTVDTSDASHGKASITSDASMHKNLQSGLVQSSSSCHLNDGNDDAKIMFGSTSDPQPSDSENAEEAAPQLPKPSIIKLHEPASSSRYANRRHIQDRGDGMHQSNRGQAQGRGRGNLPTRGAMYGYQSYRGHPVGRGNVIIGAPSYPRQLTIGPGRGYRPNTTGYPRRYAGSHAHEGGSKVSPSVTRFTEDFDFEAMNQKFNKEEVWGLLGKGKPAEAEDKEGDDKDGDTSDAQDEAGDELPKLDQAPVYCKDDFFDSISCRSLDAESGRGKMKLSEQRRIDAETFGEIPKPRQGRGVLGPQRGGSFQGSYRGRGPGNAGRGRAATYWNRMT